jgi:hypothetical protein
VAPLTSFFFEGAVDMGDGDNNDGNNGDNNDDNNNDDDNNNNEDNDTVFMCFDPADLPFLTSFVGVTIEGGGLRFMEVIAFDGVLIFVVLAMVGCLFWFGFEQFFLIEKKIKIKNKSITAPSPFNTNSTNSKISYIYLILCV